MESDRPHFSQPNSTNSKPVKSIQWEDFEVELARLLSLSSALNEAEEKKIRLTEKLVPIIQVQEESLSRSNKLGEMREKFQAKKLAIRKMSMHSKLATGDNKKHEELLSDDVRSLLVAGTHLSDASKKLQEGNMWLLREREYFHLKSLQTMLRKRQQYMISRVSFLYPVKALIEPGQELELEYFPSTTSRSDHLLKTENSYGSIRPLSEGALSISGLQLSMLPFTKISFFTDKKVIQSSATALGYVAHAVLLIASYLDVPLRYPLRFGCSRTYITDPTPSIDSNSYGLPLRTVEFPLFLEGQDPTRAAYAVFLLNKDLEQMLNFVGAKSLGPRRVLSNLKELVRMILSSEYLGT